MMQPSVWIVYTEDHDESVEIAAQTFLDEMKIAEYVVRETTLSRIDLIPLYSDAIILIGHGQPDGLEILDTVVSWTQVNNALEDRKSRLTMFLACDSPSNPNSNIFGFSGQIDAEAGALIAAWKVMETISPNRQVRVSSESILDAQKKMNHPLGAYVYFVHGYSGSNSEFGDMIAHLPDLGSLYDGYDFFSYPEKYWWMNLFDIHNIEGGISTYAEDFKDKLVSQHPSGTQIDIVSFSLGGIITREMLRLYRPTLESHGIEISRAITLGSPHYGTELTDYEFLPIVISALASIASGTLWFTDVFRSLNPQSTFISTLNQNPASYSSGIEWYGIGGLDSYWGTLLMVAGVHSSVNDIITTTTGSIPPLYTEYAILNTWHNGLVEDLVDGLSYPYVEDWLAGGIDSDSDGILNVEEIHLFGTDPYDSDSDDDGLNDYEELAIHQTNPLAWSTDADVIGDGNEIAWGYDPHDTDDPIDADYLTYYAWQFQSSIGHVRANHYTAMDYVKVYAKYKTSSGSWTGYSHVGTDYTPDWYGDYHVGWSIPEGYVQMLVKVEAYDSAHHYLGFDTQYVDIPEYGGGKGPFPE
jgi:hypothetical protein